MLERFEVERGGPRIIHQDKRADLVSCFADAWDVTDFKGQRPRALREHDPRVSTKKTGNTFTQERIEKFDFYAEASEDLSSECSGRAVDIVCNQYVIASPDEGC
ncbi:hypothetical protein D3C81_1663960 [compost metagenome]